jgi:hypothetical protein
MKCRKVRFGLLLCILGAGPVLAGDSGLRGDLRKLCDPVCELRAQDGAFSLLVESYRQFQSYQIEADYQMRLRAAEGMGNERGSLVIESSSKGIQTLRQYIYALARIERDLRFERLETQCKNFHAAYSCVRKVDEDFLGENVPSAVDQRVAAQKLKDYCVVTPGALAQANIRKAGCLPASTVLLDAPPVAPDAKHLIEPCE